MYYENYEKIRDSKGLTDYRVAKMTEIGHATFADWKTGKTTPKLDKLQKIANALMVPLESITNVRMVGTGYKPPCSDDSDIIKIQHVQRMAKAWNLSEEDEEFLQQMLMKPELLVKMRKMYEFMKDA